MRKVLIAALATLGLMAGSADAKPGVKIGVLTCELGPHVGLIVASSKSVDCVYRSVSGRREYYEGRLGKIGIDIGFTGGSILVWAVFAPGNVKRGGLEGHYGGANAEATVAVGLGANVLVGGFKHTIALQPVSVQAQTGLNVAAGLAGLSLDYVRG